MSVYPMFIDKMSMHHKGGTKSYHAVRIVNSEGMALLVFRWGKKGTFGEMQIKQMTKEESLAAFNKKVREKQSGGYQLDPSEDISSKANNEEELRRAIGRVMMPQMGASNMKFIDPDFDVSGLREPLSPTRDENGATVDAARRNLEFKRLAELEKQKAEDEAQAQLRALPTFGMF